VLRPAQLPVRSVCFTHNVEAEIFERHAANARGVFKRWMWSSQHRKMRRFEAQALRSYDRVVAVSERDARHFGSAYGVRHAEAIPTGVDLDFFSWSDPQAVDEQHPATAVFVGSMDSAANIDAVAFFIRQVWPLVLAKCPQAQFLVVGRNPPSSLQALGRSIRQVTFTGSVPDVRPYVRGAHVSVIPLLVGGGTRIKAFESMSMGCPVVSTAIGIEGLSLMESEHFLQGNDAASFAQAVLRLFDDAGERRALAARARAFVEQRFGHRVAAEVFEQICLRALKP
jgi:glycosyltransferase involved in cell wall biosynthesis